MSSEFDSSQDTVRVAGLVRSDEGTSHGHLNSLDFIAINMQDVFVAKFQNWEVRRSHKRHTFLENLAFREKERGATIPKS